MTPREDGSIVLREMQYSFVSFFPSLPPLFFKGKGWRSRVSDESLYSIIICASVEVEISLEMALRGHYRGRLYHRDAELVEALPPPVSDRCMRELAGLLSMEGGNAGSSGPVLPSRQAVGVVSPARPLNSVPSCSFVGAQAERVTTPVRKRRNACVVSSSDKETESDDVGLYLRKERRIVSMSRFLGSIGDVLGNKFSMSVQKNKVVIPDSATSPPLSFSTSSPINLSFESTFGSALGSPGVPFSQRSL